MVRLLARLLLVAAFAGAAAYVLPPAWRGLELALAAENDPAKFADLQLADFNREQAVNEIEAALKAGDGELADSFAALAADRGIELPKELLTRIEAANSAAAAAQRSIYNFAHGFITGEPQDLAGFAGATTGDLFVFGDVRDLAREGGRWATGGDADPLIVGLAAAGLAVTAGTYFSLGAAAPVRVGSTLLKVARRTGRIGTRLADNVTGLLKGGRRARVADALVDVAQIQRRGGTRAALESLRHADNVTDIARAGKIAEKKGKSTLAIFKRLGRGAVALGAGALAISGWIIGAASSMIFFIIAVVSFFATLLRWLWPSRRPERARRAAAAREPRILFIRNPDRIRAMAPRT